MELRKITDTKTQNDNIQDLLKTVVSNDDRVEIVSAILEEIEYGSLFFSLFDSDQQISFFLVTQQSDEDTGENYAIVNEIWFRSGHEDPKYGNYLASKIKELKHELKVTEIEIILNQDTAWISNLLLDEGYICDEVKLEKYLPNTHNLDDVLELLSGTIDQDYIIEILLQKDNEFRNEFIEERAEIDNHLEDGWKPVLINISFEPKNQQISETLDNSNQVILWDDYELLYRL